MMERISRVESDLIGITEDSWCVYKERIPPIHTHYPYSLDELMTKIAIDNFLCGLGADAPLIVLRKKDFQDINKTLPYPLFPATKMDTFVKKTDNDLINEFLGYDFKRFRKRTSIDCFHINDVIALMRMARAEVYRRYEHFESVEGKEDWEWMLDNALSLECMNPKCDHITASVDGDGYCRCCTKVK